MDGLRCFCQTIENNLLGNKYALNAVLMRLLISSRDHCFKEDAKYWGERLWDLTGCEIASSSLLVLSL